MRPRSRLSKRGAQLPTIREASEDTVMRDMNQANSLHSQPLSTEDYLLSICHLAHPTFPTRDPPPPSVAIISARQQQQQHDSPHRAPRTPGASEPPCAEDDVRRGEKREDPPGRHRGASDPLEYLFGHRSDLEGRGLADDGGGDMRRYRDTWEGQSRSRRAHSVPHASTPALARRQRKSSCPELPGGVSDVSPERSPPPPPRQGLLVPDRGAAEGAAKRGPVVVKHSLISQWISDCRSAWREAHGRACTLPSIAEM